jgi:hypothetical protein
MTMRLCFALIVMALTVAASASEAAACMRANEAGEIAEGRLSQGTFEDAAGQPEQAFILTLPAATCLAGPDEFDSVASASTIHIYSFEDAVAESIKRLVGKDVKVRGTPFGAHTAHHHAPIVMEVSEIDEI